MFFNDWCILYPSLAWTIKSTSIYIYCTFISSYALFINLLSKDYNFIYQKKYKRLFKGYQTQKIMNLFFLTKKCLSQRSFHELESQAGIFQHQYICPQRMKCQSMQQLRSAANTFYKNKNNNKKNPKQNVYLYWLVFCNNVFEEHISE